MSGTEALVQREEIGCGTDTAGAVPSAITRYSGKPEVSFAFVRYTWHACSGNLTQTQVHASVVVSQTSLWHKAP
jgi:hypothetical protein